MSKQLWKRIGIAILLSSALVMIVIGVTYASNYKSQSFAGDTATALKVNRTLISNYKWRAEVYSDMYNNTVIDALGWSSWNAYNKCGITVISWTTLGAESTNNVAHRTGTYDKIFYGCNNGSRRIGQNGSHEYKEGSSTIYLYTIAEGLLN